MRTCLLLFFCSFILTPLWAQNYKPIHEGEEGYFINSTGEINGVKTTRLDTVGADTLIRNYYLFAEDSLTCMPPVEYSGHHTIYANSFLGKDIQIHTNGNCSFYNKLGNEFRLQSQTLSGGSWNAFDLGGGNYIQATVSEILEANVLGNLDSVKIITLQAKDSQSADITNIFNGKEIQLGKNSGFVRTYNFLKFPSDTNNLTTTDKGRLTRKDVYDWNVGDVVQIRVSGGGWGVPDTNAYITKTVLEKTYSQGQETVSLTMRRDFISWHLLFTPPSTYTPADTSIYSDTVTVIYDSLSNYISQFMPNETQFSGSHPFSYTLSSRPSNFQGRTVMELWVNNNLQGFNNDTCWFYDGFTDGSSDS